MTVSFMSRVSVLSVQCNESGAHEKYRAISLRRSQSLIAPTGCGRDVAVEFQLRQRPLQVRDALPAARHHLIELEQLVAERVQHRRVPRTTGRATCRERACQYE